jgi:hypothetical protein
VRYFGYIWAMMQIDSPWAMGRVDLQLMAWAIGLIVPMLLAAGVILGFNKATAIVSVCAITAAALFLASWLIELDHWMHAPPPTDCGRDACDNDGIIRSLFAVGVLLLPAIIPSLFAGSIALFIACQRAIKNPTPAQQKFE